MDGGDYIVIRDDDGSGFLAGPSSLDGDRIDETLVVETHDGLDAADVAELRSDPKVRMMAPDFPLTLHKPVESEVEAPLEIEVVQGRTWGLDAVGVDNESHWSGKGATVAVLDTGIEVGHPAFAHMSGRIDAENFTNESDDDINGHGTHCAGTIFGTEIDGIRIGVAPGIERALIAKVIGRRGGSTKALVKAIQWAAGNGANVISMSLGFDFTRYVKDLSDQFPKETNEEIRLRSATSQALEAYLSTVQIIDTLVAQLVALQDDQAPLFIAATGNDSFRGLTKPAVIGACPPAVAANVLAVGAVGLDVSDGLQLAPFSNAGADLVAPGVAIVSAVPHGEMDSKNGTSMATPHVAGLAALWFEYEMAQNQMCSAKDLLANLRVSASAKQLSTRADVGRGLPTAPSPQ